MSNQSTSSMRGTGAIEGGPLIAVAGIALLINLVGLYAFTGVALCVFGYILLTLMLSSRAERGVQNPGCAQAGTAVLLLSWLVALVGGVLVGAFHWVQYAHVAYSVLATYAFAVLIWLIGRAFASFWNWLFPVVGLAMLMAVMQLGAPPGADDMDKKESWTPVNVTALDESGQPIEGATVYLDLVHFWQGDPPLEEDREWWSKDTTDGEGSAQMAVHEDPRFKRFVIRVRHDAAAGYNEPVTFGGCVGHEDARLQTALSAEKVPYLFQVTMRQREHPDSALLAIEVDPAVEPDTIVGRNVKLALTADAELPWYEGGQTFNEYAVANNGLVRDLYMSEPQRRVLRLGPDLAARPLTLHVLERDYSQYADSCRTLARFSVTPVALGEQCTLPIIRLPAQRATTRSESVAGGNDNGKFE